MTSSSNQQARLYGKAKTHKFDSTKQTTHRFLESVINEFKKKEERSHEEEDEPTLIPPSFFEEKKQFLLIEFQFYERNEIISRTFIKKLHSFTNNKYDAVIKWLTKKTSSLFPLKDKNQHPSCKIYRGDCSCGEV